MQYFVVSDVHSNYDLLVSELNNAGFDLNNPYHILISCGDLLDKGPQPNECLNFVNKLYAENRAILIRGNHETMINGYLKNGSIQNKDCEKTVSLLTDTAALHKYLDSLLNYFETSKYIFVHSWLPNNYKYAGSYEWVKASWENPLYRWATTDKNTLDKIIVSGHLPVIESNFIHKGKYDTEILNLDKFISLDADVCNTDKLNVLKLEELF